MIGVLRTAGSSPVARTNCPDNLFALVAELEYALHSKRSVLVTCRFDSDRAHHLLMSKLRLQDRAAVSSRASYARGRRFESGSCYQLPPPTTFAPVAKLEDALHLKRSDRRLCRFDPGQAHHGSLAQLARASGSYPAG